MKTGLLVLLAGTLTAAASGAGGGLTYGFKASLDARQQVPRQAVPAPLARGSLSGTLLVSGATGKLTWQLALVGLSGAPRGAEIHLARLGKRGPAVLTLCRPCRSGARGTTRAPAKVVKAIKNGGAYVEVATKKNPSGEIRGQLRLLTGA